MLEASKSRGLLRPIKGHSLLRMPVNTFKLSHWDLAVRERIFATVNESNSDLVCDEIRFGAGRVFLDRFLLNAADAVLGAVDRQVHLYAAQANEEIGFDIGLEPHHAVINEAEQHVLVFATMRTASRDRLLKMDHVRRPYDSYSRARRELYRSGGRKASVPAADVCGDLLMCASPNTSHTVGTMSAEELIDLLVATRLAAVGIREISGFSTDERLLSDLH